MFNSFYLLDSCNQSLKWSLLGVKKSLGHALLGVQFKIPEEHPRPFHMGVSQRNSTALYRTPSPQRKKKKQPNKQANKQIEESDYILRNIDFLKEIVIKCDSLGLRIRTFFS